MAERPVFSAYQPSLEDWRGLVVLSPEPGNDFLVYDSLKLEMALRVSAFSLHAVGVDIPTVSDNLMVNFYMPGEPLAEDAIKQSVSSIYSAARDIELPMQFTAMQLGRYLDIQLMGEEYFGSEHCDVGQQGYDAYRSFSDALEVIDSL
jgi:hypothetical protein